jgi:segregation and condensation protein A
MRLRLQSFDGPLDVLLHLIKVQELNIFNIPISMITEQFLSFLHMVPDLDFQVAGEYLAMAAQLIEIKASMLIPALQNRLSEVVGDVSLMPDDDPRKRLVEQLLEFEAIKLAASALEATLAGPSLSFAPKEFKRLAEEFKDLEGPLVGDPFSLVLCFERVLLNLSNLDLAPKVRVLAQRITIQQKMIAIKKRFEQEPPEYSATLRMFLWECEDRYELIVTIMAALELSKAGHIEAIQVQEGAPITLTRGVKFYEDAPELFDEDESDQDTPKPVATKSSVETLDTSN